MGRQRRPDIEIGSAMREVFLQLSAGNSHLCRNRCGILVCESRIPDVYNPTLPVKISAVSQTFTQIRFGRVLIVVDEPDLFDFCRLSEYGNQSFGERDKSVTPQGVLRAKQYIRPRVFVEPSIEHRVMQCPFPRHSDAGSSFAKRLIADQHRHFQPMQSHLEKGCSSQAAQKFFQQILIHFCSVDPAEHAPECIRVDPGHERHTFGRWIVRYVSRKDTAILRIRP
jgi:hypothetical protein